MILGLFEERSSVQLLIKEEAKLLNVLNDWFITIYLLLFLFSPLPFAVFWISFAEVGKKMSAWIILRNCLNKSLDWALMNCKKLEKHSELYKGQCEKTPLLPPAASVLTKPNQRAKMCLHVYLQIKQNWSSLLSSVSRFPAWAPSGPPRAMDPGCHGLLGWTILSLSVSKHKPVPSREDRGRSGLNSTISLY